jgi:hypothetical protein
MVSIVLSFQAHSNSIENDTISRQKVNVSSCRFQKRVTDHDRSNGLSFRYMLNRPVIFVPANVNAVWDSESVQGSTPPSLIVVLMRS